VHGFCILCQATIGLACTLHIHTPASIQLFCVQGCKKSCSYLAQAFLQPCTLCNFTIVQRFCVVCTVARRFAYWRVSFLLCTPIYGHYYITLAFHSFIIPKWKLVVKDIGNLHLACWSSLMWNPWEVHHTFIIYENVEQEKGNFNHVQLYSTSRNWLPKLQWVKLWWDCSACKTTVIFGGGTVLLVLTSWVKWQDLLRGSKLYMTRPHSFLFPCFNFTSSRFKCKQRIKN